MTSLKASYKPGQEVMLLQYGKMTSMIYVDGGVAHVLSTNLDY